MSSNATRMDKPPVLPPKKIAPDPDYEVIEFSNEQYSNAQPIIRSSNGRTLDALKCELCGSMTAKVKCDQCNQQLFCSPCDDMFHRHPKRNTHIRKAIVIQSDVKPPLPPKGEILLPVPPPRRKKTGMTPCLPRKEMPYMQQRPQAPPSPALSLRERVSSIKRLIVPGSKNATETQQKKEAQSPPVPRSETPNSDSSAKLPSLAMERIKIHTNNARDRMEIMQKRYHEYKESLKDGSNQNLATINASPNERFNNVNSSNRSDSFGVRLRSGSLSNFSNQNNKQSNNGRFIQNSNDFDETTTQDDGSMSDTRSRAFSSSVHDLSFGRNNPNNQWPQQPFAGPFGYMPNQYHNHVQPNACMNCSQQQLWNPQMMEPQWNAKNLNGSNMSLNLPQGGFYPPQFNMGGTNWMNNGSYQKPDQYSYPFGMMPYNNAYPHSMSRPHSRVPSRAASPALSSKSRKSTMSARNLPYRNSYVDQQLTDDESSDSLGYVEDLNHEKFDRRNSIERSMRHSRHIIPNSPQRSYDEDSEVFSRRSFRHNSRGRRASSTARSLSSRSERRPSHGIRSDSTQDSGSELGTRALVQAKIREKVAQASSLDESSDLSKSKGPAQPKFIKKPTTTTKTNKPLTRQIEQKQSVVQKSTAAAQTEKPKETLTKRTEPSKRKETPPKSSEKIEVAKAKEEEDVDLNNIPDAAPSGPPPSTPDYEWECEFCTFTNEAKTKICAICCKTPTTKATRKQAEEPKQPINGKMTEQAEISKEGFWIVSTSEDDISEIESYESESADVEWEAEKSDNDLEVMNILCQQNLDENVENDIIENGHESEKEMENPPIDFASQNDESRTSPINIEEKTQNNENNTQANAMNEENTTQQNIENTSLNAQEQLNESNITNENRKPSLDAELLAYIDQSLKTLIGAGSNISNQNIASAFPFLPSQMYMNNNVAPLQAPPVQVPTMQAQPMQVPPMQIPQMDSANNSRTSNDMQLYKALLGANNYSYDEIQVALASCPDADPITWLNDNWQKLIETVQTLATKYGQEHKENIVGTISAPEAREALKKHKGNVWHAVTECIETRQMAFNTIKSTGNFSSEDIVTYLTAHHGNLEKALDELNQVQMKPFLMKILNSPPETSNGFPKQETAVDVKEEKPTEPPGYKQVQEMKEQEKPEEKNLLKDIEAIIGSMELKQSKQTEALLQTIETLVGNLNTSHISRPMSSASSFSMASLDRIDMKSPIVVQSKSNNNTESSSDVENDVKDFVSRHIQDIVPDVAVIVNKELVDETNNADKRKQTSQMADENVPSIITTNDPVVETLPTLEDPVIEPPQAETIQVESKLDVSTVRNENNESASNETNSANLTSTNTRPKQPESNENTIENNQPKLERTPQGNRMKFNVNSLYPRLNRVQMEKQRMRKIEKQLRKQQKRNSIASTSEQRTESQNTGYLSDATITPDVEELPHVNDQVDNPVSKEKTFSLSIVEQAIVDNNKEYNQPVVEAEPISLSSNMESFNERDPKSRNLSELVQDTKNLIQQMKFEINEDIAASASEYEFDGDDGDMYLDDDSMQSDYSDSWEDIDNESEVSGEEFSENELIEMERNDDYYARSSQSVESEYFSEAREHISQEEDTQNLLAESDEEEEEEEEEMEVANESENFNFDEIKFDSGNQDEVQNDLENEVQNEVPDQEVNTEEILPSVESAVEEEPQKSVNDGAITEHMIEIQQSLHTSSVVSLNIREGPNREKSTSTEPSATPVPITNDERAIREESASSGPSATSVIDEELTVPETPNRNVELTVQWSVDESVTSDLISEELTVAEQLNIVEEYIEQESNDVIETELVAEEIAPDYVEPIAEDVPEHSSSSEIQLNSDEMPHDENGNLEITEEPIGNHNDTESEIDEISADVSHASVSTTDESVSKDMSSHSSVSLAPSESIVESYKYKKITVPVITQCSQNASSINVMQLKKSDSIKSATIKNKIPVRRPSFTEPSASIRNIQNELMNKQLRQPPLRVSKKPSKIVPPKLFFKSGFTSQEDNRSPKATNGKKSEQTDNSMPSTSTGYQTIPKKKYFETCFSDDYQTSDDESRPVTSKKVIPNLVQIVETSMEESFDVEAMAERFLQEGKAQSHSEAILAVSLIQQKFREDKALWAATQCNTIDQAIDLLQQDCELCMESYPINRIVSMLKCTHSCCEDCAKNYFTIQITDRSITDCTCPFCKLPDLNAAETTEDDALEYFSNMDILLKSILDESVHELFQRKLRDRTLMQDPNFKWCVQCSSGFFARPRQKKFICPDCGSITCAQCRKTWEAQHEGITCDQFSEWKELNDPDNQAQGVAQHLQLHGISCPKCKFKYSLARGGCMHFTCSQCKYEFCYGCNKPFKMGAKCKVSDYCAKLGLHSHHPRNCLFYLRDKDPNDLQTLLTMHNVPYNTDPLDFGVQQIDSEENTPLKKLCPMPIQKETPSGLIDTVCNGDIEENSAGLCRSHFVEYLVSIVAKANIDPLPILDLTDCVQELRRSGIALPDRGPWDTDPIYRDMCSKIVEKHIPLD